MSIAAFIDSTEGSSPSVRRRFLAFDFELDLLAERDVMRCVEEGWARGTGGWILTVNTDILRRVVRDSEFRALASNATIKVVDGVPILWAARLAHGRSPERVAGADLLWALSGLAAACRRSVLLVGGNPGVADGTARQLTSQFPNLRIVGSESPPYGFEADEHYQARLDALARDAQPDLVFVALGCPRQDLLIARLRRLLPGAWFVGVGIAFSYAAGEVERAPDVLQRVGLEWAHRLAQEPRRLSKRYVVDDFPFAIRLLIASGWRGLVRTWTTRRPERRTRKSGPSQE